MNFKAQRFVSPVLRKFFPSEDRLPDGGKPSRTMASVLVALIATSVAPALAQTQAKYPADIMRMVVTFAAGGPNDILARLLAPEMASFLGTTVIVENKPGANTQIGTEDVARARSDGSSVLLTSFAVAFLPITNKGMRLDVTKDLTPITRLVDGPTLMVVNKAFPAKNFQEFLVYAKANPGKLNFAVTGAGDLFAGELLKLMANFSTETVRFGGIGQAVQGILGGEIHYVFATPGAVNAQLDSGALRALAVTSRQRIVSRPDIPTIAESGVPDFQFMTWASLFGPAGMPRPLVDRLNKAAIDALKTPNVRQGTARLGVEMAGTSPEDFAKFLSSEVGLWTRVAQQTNVKFE